MSTVGLLGLLVAFASVVISVISLIIGRAIYVDEMKEEKPRGTRLTLADTFTWGGRIASVIGLVCLTLCCGILVYCFMTGDTSIYYVVSEQSNDTSELSWLYKLAGLWAGRQGSLLFWAWLISVFNTVVAFRGMKKLDPLDSMALLVSQIVLGAFVGVILFSESNMPFTVTPSQYFDVDGNLQGAATLWGMNAVLEHWAMAIHPPTLFVGYAGLTIPFAYAIAALIVNDSSKAWVERSTRYALFSWIFLSIGIGLGAIWAYGVLGWGGYWGWDPVENASLLSWLVGVALLHSFTVYRQRGAFKKWSIMCACLTFSFVIVGTFITRSGVVSSVHAFEGDSVSLVLFLALIIVSLVAGAVGLLIRRKTFTSDTATDEVENMLSKDAAYYFNNVIMVVFAVVLAYMTLTSALPEWLPFGGESLSTSSYNAIARPLGIVYLGILAVCPLLSWGKTEGKQFASRIKVPAICAAVIFVALMVYYFAYLLPSYNAIIDAGGTAAETLLMNGAPVYYAILTILGFAVASLLCCNALFMLGRCIANYKRTHKTNVFGGVIGMLRGHASTFGGSIAHFGMAIILVGLIGSAMYVTEEEAYLLYDEEADTASDLVIQDYTLKYTGNDIEVMENEDDILYTLHFDVYKDGTYVGTADPSVQLIQSTNQRKLNAAIISTASEDLFVVYNGMSSTIEAFSMNAYINPLVSFVWVGFGILCLGGLIALVGRRHPKKDDPMPEVQFESASAEKAALPEVDDVTEDAKGADGAAPAESAVVSVPTI